jgi:hypothetical protein
MSDLRFRRAAGMVACVAVLSLLGACGGTHPGARRGTSSAPADMSSPRSPALRTELVDSLFPATGAQFSIGARLVGAMQATAAKITATCMVRYGFHVRRESAAQAAGRFFDNSQFPDLAKISSTGTFGVTTIPDLGPPPGMPRAGQRAYTADLKRCASTAADLFGPFMNASGSLQSQWFTIITRIESSPAVVAALGGYRSCMERAGVPAARVTSSSSAGAFGLFLAWESGQESRARGTAGALAVDRHWAPVFASCAKAAVSTQEPLQLAAQKTFLHEHYQQVQALKSLARKEVAAAGQRHGTARTR